MTSNRSAHFIGLCSECGFLTSATEDFDVSHYMTVNGLELLKALHGWEGVCQELGEHWYKQHPYRHRYYFAISRHTVDLLAQILVIGGTKNHLKSRYRCTDAEEWARSYIEVKEHDEGSES